MKKTKALSKTQQKLVEQNLDVVRWVIYRHIHVNESIIGLSFDDLFQEGCFCLCRAAATYNGKNARFSTYASVVVRNGLLSYCKAMSARQKKQLPLQALVDPEEEDGDAFLDFLATEDFTAAAISDMTALDLLESVKGEYDGVAKLGIEALELKIKGLSGGDIAKLYGVAPNHVGAWISRAAEKLRQNERFLMGFDETAVEKRLL